MRTTRKRTGASDVSADLEEIARLAAEEPLEDDEATRLFTKILTIVKGGREPAIDAERRAAIAREVERTVQQLVAQRRGRGAPAEARPRRK
jgi:hypothetical protein